ncbi:cytochrome c biogenesis protein CcsA [Promethearchaeum syntrophicum]|uniref:Cytochrome c biogenesis protein CcsA n=1 Tax=Promethearchaeum syntrophicum TaxID=2594042 RepID=A0A5B9DEF7_9ARCH|nr:cytochrome c biogenesis protein CcsA [Candidatus Prometheoarchaeum syntrophicum]QEE17494.1 Cytochrome c biogenesis protein CcsA [Candidatus Prometheoarchaeum syntrophicum]
MWLLILHVFINVLGLVFLMAGSFQILISSSKNSSTIQSEELDNSFIENNNGKSKEVRKSKNKLIEIGWYLYTFGVILGAFQAKITVGYYWTWDLKEIFSLLSILGYFSYIIIEMKWNKRVKQFLILISLILTIITVIIPAIAYSYHNPFTLIGFS